MIALLRTTGQFAVVLGLFALVAAVADWPVYRQIPSGSGVLMLSFVHGADRRADCRRLTAAEIAKRPPNMRRTMECPRDRRAIYVELEISGRDTYRAHLAPTGIAGDGPSRVYERFVLPAGEYDIAARLRDTARSEGFDYERRERIALSAKQLLVVDFRPQGAGFIFQ